ncbi:MAG: methylenetetrahydrofolate--tRNA-(uracil(54)-C(5))-methyltransferase (FADH(2)-oxidizing) TrmFO [Deltaproteobacteria bacterium]|nr:methylenetetrahydrofolate--tRNA-(uracil(54)-C(5))-methyltransferase (FADH(2)-oxidizing) TrmFO [Deltaproteobacteria bacterium]
MNDRKVMIVGGGLAGCEAAWQLVSRGIPPTLHEMKPRRFSPAHKSPGLAELVCSNSFRSGEISTAAGLLKEEMRLLKSVIIEAADASSVPAGKALAVDRAQFSSRVEALLNRRDLQVVRDEVKEIPAGTLVLIATGPLTSDALAEKISGLTGRDYLYFYDAISPIVDAATIDLKKTFSASRYQEGDGDYLNCPLTAGEYERFHRALLDGRQVPPREFEDSKFFEGCLPVEVMASRGASTLLFGPMKPVGLVDPETGKKPHAVVQLRSENRQRTAYNLVGFQTKLTWPEQGRVFRMIPGLERAEFLRFGSIHRNTFINAPALLEKTLHLRSNPDIYFAGQITGVEGYIESAATGLIAGISIWCRLTGKNFDPPPRTTALGALLHHITGSDSPNFQPMNVNFGLFEPLPQKVRKRNRGDHYAARALLDLGDWSCRLGLV